MESVCNVWVWCGCGEHEAGVASGSGWNLLGDVVKRYIDFLILLIPTPLVSVQHPYFWFLKKKCFSFFSYIIAEIRAIERTI